MHKVQRRGVWIGPLLFVMAALTAVTALLGTTPTFAHARPLPLKITTTSLPNGGVCASYTAFITANKGGGSSLDTWKLVSGALPAGLTMATSYGIQSTVVFGTPTATGTFTFTETVADRTGVHASQQFSITVN